MNQEELTQQYGRIVAQCWADPAFKARLIADPDASLAAEGVEIPAGMSLRIVENTPTLTHIVLPLPPYEGELSDDDLNGVNGAVACSACGVP